MEALQQRVLTSSQSATEKLEGLQAEAAELETTVATLTEERNRWAKQLEDGEKEVGNGGGGHGKKERAVTGSREEVAKRVRMMEELMQRVRKYQEAMMQSVTYWSVCCSGSFVVSNA